MCHAYVMCCGWYLMCHVIRCNVLWIVLNVSCVCIVSVCRILPTTCPTVTMLSVQDISLGV